MTACIKSLYSQLQFEYDLQDRIICETQTFGKITRTFDDENQTVTRRIYLNHNAEPITTTFKYNNVGELIELTLPENNQLFFEYDQNGNNIKRTTPQGFIFIQKQNEMDALIQQRAGNEPKVFFNSEELRATGIEAPSFAPINLFYRYDNALNTIEIKDNNEQLEFYLNRNNQITSVNNHSQPREVYRYDHCGYLTQQKQSLFNDLVFNQNNENNRLILNQDIYQKGNKLHRLENDYYSYDKAGRLISKTEIKNGFRKQETSYRWNGANQLIGLTNTKGESWYYKYDALGRRIAKQCPEKRINVEYIWDGDQLAYTITEKNAEIISERHSVFNGFELVTQQDYYSELKQTIDGNIKKWKFETNYAVVQPNGKVLGLFNPEGKITWRNRPRNIWGLRLDIILNPHEENTNPLDPQLLFSGQYYDEESGLAYNRFRYYDPETGNYISSDPIGLNGGETPYSYVLNPLDFVDLFGLTSCELAKSMKAAGIDRPINSAAHHIVPETAKGAKPARDILEKHGININSAENGVFLPTKNNQGTLSGIVHNGRHPNEYIEAINERMRKADRDGGRKEVINELNRVRNILSRANKRSNWRTILE